ncbi:hypothetical protein [Aquimarina brevivitae]|uniref:Uncharacterized protein n=1 Tax=Aquimarina brevivitae TaxID=323412 RepID=A0A4Q7NXA9_9FLAO|nr:hypothetical protein [Aquimarina brevivitae]RZS91905.1 hypothetical protein EV197_3009 [Aquimarina brevivitae]
MKIQLEINKKALTVAASSFILGSTLLLLYLTTGAEAILIGGLLYVLIALAVNAITLIHILVNTITNLQNYKENLRTLLLFLINIPIAIGYIHIIIKNPVL